MPQETNTSKIGALEKSVTTLVTVTVQLRAEVDAFKTDLKSSEAAVAALDKENALLQQRHDDHVRRAEVWGQRWWALVALLLGAVLTLCSGLVVALARK